MAQSCCDSLEIEAAEYALKYGVVLNRCNLCGCPILPFVYDSHRTSHARSCLNRRCSAYESFLRWIDSGLKYDIYCDFCKRRQYVLITYVREDDEIPAYVAVCANDVCPCFRIISTPLRLEVEARNND